MAVNQSYIEICYACNSNCISCPSPSSWQKKGRLSFKKLRDYFDKNVGKDSVVNINGGEPTVHPDFIKIVEYAGKSGARIGLLSNGRKFSDKKFARNSVKAGLKDICIAFHSSNEAAYDSFTRSKGSFKDTVKGVKNLCKLKTGPHDFNLILKILICKSTIKYLPDTISFINKEFSRLDTVLLEAMDIVCVALDNKDTTLINFTKAVPYISKAVNIGLAGNQNMRIHYIPPCVFPNPEFYYDMVERDLNISQSILGPNRYIKSSNITSASVKASVCAGCEADKICSGVWKSYKDEVGLEELKPIKKLKLPGFIRK